MPVPKNLPNTILDLAFKTSTGLLAWKKEDMPLVLAELVKSHLAVIGGEIWTVYPDGRHNGDVLDKEGRWGIYTWYIYRNEGESWLDFVQRAALYTQDRILTFNTEERTRPDIAPLLRYNLDIDDEDTYNEFRSRYPRGQTGQG